MLKYTTFDIVFQEIPDEVTLAINISGCPNRCQGCHTPQLMEDIGKELDFDVLQDLVDRYGTSLTAICFMGGDNDPSQVELLARYIRSICSLKIGWYSGRESIPMDLSAFDYIKLGGYISSKGGLDSVATNQRMYRVVNENLVDITSKFWNVTLDKGGDNRPE